MLQCFLQRWHLRHQVDPGVGVRRAEDVLLGQVVSRDDPKPQQLGALGRAGGRSVALGPI
jgi:hypothetical protein